MRLLDDRKVLQCCLVLVSRLLTSADVRVLLLEVVLNSVKANEVLLEGLVKCSHTV
jgi:hypothetical protein